MRCKVFASLLVTISLNPVHCQLIAADGPDFEQVLAEKKSELPKDATFTLGDSPAARLVISTELAILDANRKEFPDLTLDRSARERAFDTAVHSIAGTRIPTNFLELAREHPQVDAAQSLTLSPGADPTAKKFDWRQQSRVSHIRDQNPCGCCWCFAAVAAFEGNHLLRFNGTPDSIDVSEQEILNCGHTGGCDGDWYMTAWKFMQQTGTATEKDVPYRGSVEACKSGITTPYHVDTYGLVSTQKKIPDVNEIKEALCHHGPLAVAVQANDLFILYKSGVFKDIDSDRRENGVPKVNHAVTIIGWNDDDHAWIIKNSWGPKWGETAGVGSERGYMRINYDSNNIGYAAAWVESKQ